MFSFTLQVKSDGYKRSRNTRVFLCAASPDESGREALDWSLESLVQDGDELIVFRGVDEDVLGGLSFCLTRIGRVADSLLADKLRGVIRDEAEITFPFIRATFFWTLTSTLTSMSLG